MKTLSLNVSRRLLFSFFSSHHLRPFSSSSPIRGSISSPTRKIKVRVSNEVLTGSKAREKLTDDWLSSLSCPLTPPRGFAGDGDHQDFGDSNSDLILGIDPDNRGAVALLRGNASDCSAQVFDTPVLQILIDGKVRKRLDTKSTTELLRSFDAPVGTTAYIEESHAFSTSGKTSNWGSGFVYGLWIGTLVASGFSVVPVSSLKWKRKFDIFGTSFTKDDSRRVASTLFPSLSSELKRKKDDGRADALLIAAYGRGLKIDMIS